ncbi:Suppressor of Sensor Kinase (SLN1) [Elasticomyces elasticus]|nr:Suppressor of Sensor Kinase (SLN1) [Elasticomyces elasticus]KAK3663571.1 Suppressor of Sensor Kinase (SLN1) [Elasticomyces elasticus]KAK4923559.1 Suppressor of Sensor Kinase (SLN1) [Elasticomyces elasticus]KAK5751573.1 Suppressor of Sensor Kinase (SLN1) [Elasticomyces elasticus]
MASFTTGSPVALRTARREGSIVDPIMEDVNEERPEMNNFQSSGTSGSEELDMDDGADVVDYSDAPPPPQHPVTRTRDFAAAPSMSSSLASGSTWPDGMTPSTNSVGHGWTPTASLRSNTSSNGNSNTGGTRSAHDSLPHPSIVTNGLHSTQQRPVRPPTTRQPSNAYAPARRPHQYSMPSSATTTQRNGSAHRGSRRNGPRNPDSEYRAQEKAYVQRIQQVDRTDSDFYGDNPLPPSLDYSTETSSDDESPSTNGYTETDPYEQQEMLLYYGEDDMEPSLEELRIPANRERLEWHAMLANVLTGDVVKQEKKRLIGGTEQGENYSLKTETWIGVRAKTCGRSIAAQRRLIEDGRSKIKQSIEGIIGFEIKGEAEVGKSPMDQVRDIVNRIDKIESLYPMRHAFEAAHPRAGGVEYKSACDAVIAWHNTTELINTELGILQKWVGNVELDFTKPRPRPEDVGAGQLFDDSSFIERILKEDGLKSLQGEDNLLNGVNRVIQKAKTTLIHNAEAFADRHLPPYIEELLTLINFPSRLIQEIIRMRLSYARKMKDPAQQGVMMAEQMILQFQILLKLAVRIKEAYMVIAQPEPGWDLPPCIDDGFDGVVLEALKFYFKMLNWKLMANKNTFKEAEILEQEWEFSNELGRHLDGGDVEVAEQFSSLTSKSLGRLTGHFEKELIRRPEDGVGGEVMDKRYKAILDSVRVRQRKIFRFSRLLSQRFENAREYNVNISAEEFEELVDALVISGHVLVETSTPADAGGSVGTGTAKNPVYVIASPTLVERPKDIQSMLGTCYHAEDVPEDPSDPYVLILKAEHPLNWEGQRQDHVPGQPIRQPLLDLKTGRLRLVADGSLQRLAHANESFMAVCQGIELSVLVEQRANLPRVNQELVKIRKTAYKLSNTIMDSVEIVRRQTQGLQCQELIQTCFAFATEFGQRSAIYFDQQRRAMHQLKLTHLALDWVSFICDDCVASDKKTFRWAVVALEFAMMMTRGQHILSISEEEYSTLRGKVAGCMSLLISHFDIMGARSTVAAQAEKLRVEQQVGGKGGKGLSVAGMKDDEESSRMVRGVWLEELERVDQARKDREAERQALGRVLEDSNDADRALTQLSASAGNVHLRWQQGQFVGGGTFGSVYVAINLDSTQLMAVKEIRLQDPKMIPTIVSQIRDEMSVLQVLNHPNVVQYFGIEPHRDKVYIFMEYCSGGSLASLLEHGRIEDETVIQVYTLQLLEGLGYLHEANVVHRDIKPENILLDHSGIIKFVDFGAAKVIAKQGKTVVAQGPDGRGEKGSMQGTPMYMSPEVIKGQKPHNARLGAEDIWSLGCVVSEMATGARPWAAMDNEWAIMYNIAQGHAPAMPSKEQMSEAGLEFLRRCFDRDPVRRASAAELLQCEWILGIRQQLDIQPQTPQTPASESGYGSTSSGGSGSANGSREPSRQNSGW